MAVQGALFEPPTGRLIARVLSTGRLAKQKPEILHIRTTCKQNAIFFTRSRPCVKNLTKCLSSPLRGQHHDAEGHVRHPRPASTRRGRDASRVARAGAGSP